MLWLSARRGSPVYLGPQLRKTHNDRRILQAESGKAARPSALQWPGSAHSRQEGLRGGSDPAPPASLPGPGTWSRPALAPAAGGKGPRGQAPRGWSGPRKRRSAGSHAGLEPSKCRGAPTPTAPHGDGRTAPRVRRLQPSGMCLQKPILQVGETGVLTKPRQEPGSDGEKGRGHRREARGWSLRGPGLSRAECRTPLQPLGGPAGPRGGADGTRAWWKVGPRGPLAPQTGLPRRLTLSGLPPPPGAVWGP